MVFNDLVRGFASWPVETGAGLNHGTRRDGVLSRNPVSPFCRNGNIVESSSPAGFSVTSQGSESLREVGESLFQERRTILLLQTPVPGLVSLGLATPENDHGYKTVLQASQADSQSDPGFDTVMSCLMA